MYLPFLYHNVTDVFSLEEQELILGAVFSKDQFHISWETIQNKEGDYTLRPYFIAGKRKVSLLNMKLSPILPM